MTGIEKSLQKMTDQQLQMITEAIDAEVDSRAKRTVRRGYQRSTHMDSTIRGRRLAPRPSTQTVHPLAA